MRINLYLLSFMCIYADLASHFSLLRLLLSSLTLTLNDLLFSLLGSELLGFTHHLFSIFLKQFYRSGYACVLESCNILLSLVSLKEC